MNLKQILKQRVCDSKLSEQKAEKMLLEKGTLTKVKLRELIANFEKHYWEIPVNIVTNDFDWGQVKWDRIKVSVGFEDYNDDWEGDYCLKVDYLYAGYINPQTGEVTLDMDDGASWIYEWKNREWIESAKYKDACYHFMDNQEQEFFNAIRVGFEKYIKSQKEYKKYFKGKK